MELQLSGCAFFNPSGIVALPCDDKPVVFHDCHFTARLNSPAAVCFDGVGKAADNGRTEPGVPASDDRLLIEPLDASSGSASPTPG